MCTVKSLKEPYVAWRYDQDRLTHAAQAVAVYLSKYCSQKHQLLFVFIFLPINPVPLLLMAAGTESS